MEQENDMEFKVLIREEPIDAEDAATSHVESCAIVVETESGTHAAGSSGNGDGEIIRRIPDFPGGKDRHFFVSHSSDDLERVTQIVEELENRFNITCILADRDFQSGKNIVVNIKESMQRSMKVLLMLSPNFTKSGWCKYEREFAFMSHIESGVSCVVPVLLEMCEVPETLVTLTYIDATLPGVDIPARIADALTRSEIAEGQSPLQERIMINKYENGFCVPIEARRKPSLNCRPGVYQFSLDQEVFFHLQCAKITLPPYVLEDAFGELNRFRATWGYGYTHSRARICLWTVMSFPIWILLYILVIVSVSHGKSFVSDNSVSIMYVIITTTASILAASFIAFCLFIPVFCNRRKKSENIQSVMWEKIQKICLRNNVILLYEQTRKKAPTLYVMRYNVKQCQDYLAALIRSRSLAFYDEVLSPEECAEQSIEHHVRQIQGKMTAGLDELPDAPYNRHNVKKGKICLCQQIESKYPVV